MSAYDALAELAEAAAASKGKARDLAANAEGAKAKVGDAYTALVEAHAQDDPAKVKQAQKAHTVAKAELEARVAEAQGAELRARRDELAVASYRRDNADALLAEKAGPAEECAASIVTALQAAVGPAAEWHQHAHEIRELVQASGKGDPRQDCPAAHGFEAVIQTIEQALATIEIASPMPHYRHVRFLEQQQREAEERARTRGDQAA